MTVRIIAGENKGAPLQTPRGMRTRPTLGRVRESLFMILMPHIEDARVLDLFAGSGALGFEALSRGAKHVTFVEQSRPAITALRENMRRLKCTDRVELVEREALAYLSQAVPAAPYDLILLDPPYQREWARKSIERVARASERWLADDGLLVAQTDAREALADRFGPLTLMRNSRYGGTRLWLFARSEEAGGQS